MLARGDAGTKMEKKIALAEDSKMGQETNLLSTKNRTDEPPKTKASLATKISQTTVMYSAFFTLGIAAAVVGPTLLDLERITVTDTDSIAWVLTSRCIGGLIGVIIMGFALSKGNPWLLMGLAHALAAVMLAIAPLFRNIVIMCFVFMFHGIGRWFVDGACNVMILAVWGQANGPWLQGLHCTTGIGALIAPMIAAPFLTPQPNNLNDAKNSTSHTNITRREPVSQDFALDKYALDPGTLLIRTNSSSNLTTQLSVNFLDNFSITSLKICSAYSIASLMLLISSACMLLLFCVRNRYPSIKRSPKHDDDDNVSESDKNQCGKACTTTSGKTLRLKIFHLQILFLGASFDAILCLVAVNYGNFVFSFAVKHLGWSNKAAVSISSAYWGTFICARGLAVVISKVLRPGKLLLLCILLALASSIPLAFFVRVHPAVFWAGSIGFGMAVSPMFATSVSLMGCYINVSGPEGAVLVTATLVGEMTGPVLVSMLYGQYGHMSLIYLIVGVSAVLLVIAGLIFVVGKTGQPQLQRQLLVNSSERNQEDESLQEKKPVESEMKV